MCVQNYVVYSCGCKETAGFYQCLDRKGTDLRCKSSTDAEEGECDTIGNPCFQHLFPDPCETNGLSNGVHQTEVVTDEANAADAVDQVWWKMANLARTCSSDTFCIGFLSA
jgi:hypothetical protein